MVSTRRNPSPAPPEICGARQVPDDPPPRPPQDFITASAELDQSSSHHTGHVNGSISLPESARNDEAQSTVEQMENDESNIADGPHSNSANDLLPDVQHIGSAPSEGVISKMDVEDDDAPEEASATVAAETALAQRKLEHLTRTSVRERQRSRRRVTAEKQRREAQKKRAEVGALGEVVTTEGKEIHYAERMEQNGKEMDQDTKETSALISKDVLAAAQRAIGERRRADRERRKGEKLKRQSKKVATHLPIKLVDGVEIKIAGRVQKKAAARGRGKRNPATAFLETCIKNAGERVSSTVAARIASVAKRKSKET